MKDKPNIGTKVNLHLGLDTNSIKQDMVFTVLAPVYPQRVTIVDNWKNVFHVKPERLSLVSYVKHTLQ